MAGLREVAKPKPALRTALGALMVLLAIPLTPWNRHFGPDDVVIALGGIFVMLGYRRVFRAAVSRPTADEVLCRFAPWYEGYAYLQLLIPVLALAATVQGFSTGPKWMGYSGILVLLLAPIFVFGLVVARQRCFVRFNPLSVSVRSAGTVTEIPREHIEAITPILGSQRLDPRQVQITWRPADSNAGPITTVLPGLQLTVEPDNLLHALEAWNDAGSQATASDVMDQVEAILRGRAEPGPNHQHWAAQAA